ETEAINEFDHDLRALADDMVETMRVAPGVGLAAPQVGVSKKLVVVEYGSELDESFPKQLYVLANPEIIERSEETVRGIEGCLSVPDLVGTVDRAQVVTVKAQDLNGKPMKIRAEGWLARIFQHEIDHINGILYTDRTNDIWQPDEDDEDIPDV
ncbi:MAG: peptide deformylase, partial [Anaerolineaceae bacterium]|nr:peptide deformylase [Anaerolineaceae bacterium]